MQFHFYSGLPGLVNPSSGPVHKRLEFLDSIEDSLQLRPACLVLFDVGLLNPSSQNVGRMLYPPLLSPQLP